MAEFPIRDKVSNVSSAKGEAVLDSVRISTATKLTNVEIFAQGASIKYAGGSVIANWLSVIPPDIPNPDIDVIIDGDETNYVLEPVADNTMIISNAPVN